MTWENEAGRSYLAGWFRRNGVPDEVTEELLGQGELFRPFIRPVLDPELVDDGDRLHGWEIVAAPGHADGQLTLLKDGVLIAADHLLARITPTVGLWPASRPDPLGDYLGSLQRTIDLAPDDRLRRPRRHRHRSGRPGQRADRPSRRAAARHRGRDRHGAAHGVRGVVPAVRRRPAAGGAPICRRRDALPPRAARQGRRGRTPRAAAERGRRQRLLYCRAVVGELPSSTAAPETGA